MLNSHDATGNYSPCGNTTACCALKHDARAVPSGQSGDFLGAGHRGYAQVFDDRFIETAQKINLVICQGAGQLRGGQQVAGTLFANASIGCQQVFTRGELLQSGAEFGIEFATDGDCSIVGHGTRGSGQRTTDIVPALFGFVPLDGCHDQAGPLRNRIVPQRFAELLAPFEHGPHFARQHVRNLSASGRNRLHGKLHAQEPKHLFGFAASLGGHFGLFFHQTRRSVTPHRANIGKRGIQSAAQAKVAQRLRRAKASDGQHEIGIAEQSMQVDGASTRRGGGQVTKLLAVVGIVYHELQRLAHRRGQVLEHSMRWGRRQTGLQQVNLLRGNTVVEQGFDNRSDNEPRLRHGRIDGQHDIVTRDHSQFERRKVERCLDRVENGCRRVFQRRSPRSIAGGDQHLGRQI